MTHPYLSTFEVALLIKVHPNTVRRWADQGKLEHIKTPGGQYRFPVTQPYLVQLRQTVTQRREDS